MSLVRPRIATAAWRRLPAPLRRKIRSDTGNRLIRFAPAAVLALAATQITYFICFGPAGLTAGVAGATGWFAGAAVSYVVSRWAWERKGRPQLLKETLPFWAISLCVGVVLTLTSKFASHEIRVLGLHGAERALFAQGLYLAANCLTFVARFVIFHYVLFANRGAKPAAAGAAPEPAGAAGRPDLAGAGSQPAGQDDSGPLVLAADRPTEPGARR
jgi:putative flippase GtrA